MTDAGFYGTSEITQLTLGAQAQCLAVAGGELYWTDARGGVMRMAVDGGTPEVVTPCLGRSPQGIALDSSNIYFTVPDSGSVMRVEFDGGVPIAIAASEPLPFQLAVGNGIAYWTWSSDVDLRLSGVHWVDADGGLASGQGNDVSLRENYFTTNVATGPTEVGWASAHDVDDGAHDLVETVGLDGGSSKSVSYVIDNRVGIPLGIALDSNFVYWTVPGSNTAFECGGGLVMSMPLDGGAASALAGVAANPGAIIALGGSLYWIEHGSLSFASDGGPCVVPGLWRLVLDGGSPELIAASTTTENPLGVADGPVIGPNGCIAADDTSIYWIFGGQILKAAR